MATDVKLTPSTRDTLLSMQNTNAKTVVDERAGEKPVAADRAQDIIQIAGNSLTQAEKTFAQMKGATLLAQSAPSISERQELVERLGDLRRSLNALGLPAHGPDDDLNVDDAYLITRAARWALVETPLNLAGRSERSLLGLF
ncbi:hypothetical protein [Magnetospirillum gryphiswaldense]|nr:hypothetical protein [Magnetospirillum gryphiswaldense]AVM72623.1 hypothetical protein MSR1_00970 [Magnetospirillum gryphiswaldense MSR-1]AVM76526.1 hypothetical protein MSR1L_00970 [Magnetospirillum gryphiswaldense]